MRTQESLPESIGSVVFLFMISLLVSWAVDMTGYWPVALIVGGVGYLVGWAMSKIDSDKKDNQ